MLIRLAVCVGVALSSIEAATLVQGSRSAPPAGRDTSIRYIANSGMLVTVDGRRFLIDAPIREGIAPYATSSPGERRRLEGAEAPYDDIDAVLVTHWHEDHFSAEAVAALLSKSPGAVVVSSSEVVARVREAGPAVNAAQMRAVLPAPGTAQLVDIAGVAVRVLRIRHNPARRLPEQHLGFLLGATMTVLHVGDADPAADNFALLRPLPAVDVALLPYWYLLEPATRQLVADRIRPRRIVAMHVPPGEVSEVAAALQVATVNAVVAAIPGSPIVLPVPPLRK